MSLSKDEIVKEEILVNAQKLFQQFGLKKTTMDDIAESCGKAKSTLYHYFKSKEDVFDGVIGIELMGLRVIVKEKVEKVTTLNDKLITYVLEFHQCIIGKMNLYRLVKHEMKDTYIAEKQFSRFMKFEKTYILRILQDGYDIGEIKHTDKDDLYLFAEVLVAGFLGVVRYSIETENGYDQEKMELITKVLIPQLFR